MLTIIATKFYSLLALLRLEEIYTHSKAMACENVKDNLGFALPVYFSNTHYDSWN